MTASKPMARCQAETFDGIEHRQCSRPAFTERDGLPVCRQHNRLDRVKAWSPRGRESATFVEVPRTEADIVGRFTEQLRAALYITAGEMVRGDIRAGYTLGRRQRDRDQPLQADADTFVREITRSATFALVDLGALTDSEIEARLRAAVAVA